MSYGVLASKSATVLVEPLGGASGASASDAVLARFHSSWGGAWVPARVTLTRLHLNLIPHRAVPGLAMVDVDLPDILRVELSGGRVSKEIGLLLGRHRLHLRVIGAAALAQAIASAVEAAAAAPTGPRRPPTPPVPPGRRATPGSQATPGTPGPPEAALVRRAPASPPSPPDRDRPVGQPMDRPVDRPVGRHVPAWLREPVEEFTSRGGW